MLSIGESLAMVYHLNSEVLVLLQKLTSLELITADGKQNPSYWIKLWCTSSMLGQTNGIVFILRSSEISTRNAWKRAIHVAAEWLGLHFRGCFSSAVRYGIIVLLNRFSAHQRFLIKDAVTIISHQGEIFIDSRCFSVCLICYLQRLTLFQDAVLLVANLQYHLLKRRTINCKTMSLVTM